MQNVKNIILINKESNYVSLIAPLIEDQKSTIILAADTCSTMMSTAAAVLLSLQLASKDRKAVPIIYSKLLNMVDEKFTCDYFDSFDLLNGRGEENIIIICNTTAAIIIEVKLRENNIPLPTLYPLKSGEIRHIDMRERRYPKVSYLHENNDSITVY